MSTLSHAPNVAQQSDRTWRTRSLIGAFMRAWAAVNAWRIQQAAVAHLRSLNDHQLKDIGLSRSQIEAAVTGVIDLQRDRVRHLN